MTIGFSKIAMKRARTRQYFGTGTQFARAQNSTNGTMCHFINASEWRSALFGVLSNWLNRTWQSHILHGEKLSIRATNNSMKIEWFVYQQISISQHSAESNGFAPFLGRRQLRAEYWWRSASMSDNRQHLFAQSVRCVAQIFRNIHSYAADTNGAANGCSQISFFGWFPANNRCDRLHACKNIVAGRIAGNLCSRFITRMRNFWNHCNVHRPNRFATEKDTFHWMSKLCLLRIWEFWILLSGGRARVMTKPYFLPLIWKCASTPVISASISWWVTLATLTHRFWLRHTQ